MRKGPNVLSLQKTTGMKKVLTGLVAGIYLVLASAFAIQAIINWKIDSEKAMVKFSLKAHGQELIGNFKGAKGEVKFDANDLAHSSVDCTIDMATINTGIEARDKHLQAKGFFDTETSPMSKFTADKIEKTKEGYSATGKLSMKETTKELAIPFLFEANNDTGVFKGSFSIKRSDFNIGKPDDEIGDEVTIYLEIPVSKQK